MSTTVSVARNGGSSSSLRGLPRWFHCICVHWLKELAQFSHFIETSQSIFLSFARYNSESVLTADRNVTFVGLVQTMHTSSSTFSYLQNLCDWDLIIEGHLLSQPCKVFPQCFRLSNAFNPAKSSINHQPLRSGKKPLDITFTSDFFF